MTWSSVQTVKTRCDYLIRFGALIEANKNELADLIVLEHGKTKAEALAEVAKGHETLKYAMGAPALFAGRFMDVSRGVQCRDERLPVGVVVSIVPFSMRSKCCHN